jgi:hypothetical protein
MRFSSRKGTIKETGGLRTESGGREGFRERRRGGGEVKEGETA